VQDINASGGVLGRQLKLVAYDAQSDNAKYTTYANQLALRDKAVVIMGGVSSASREAVRPVARRHKIPYFYNEQYEGGVCDKNVFLTGIIPSQQIAPTMDWAVKNVGKRFYSLAADYNYGHISTQWLKHYVEKAGGEIVGSDFIPLDVSEFGSVISKLQEAKPDVVFSNLVGGNHIAFYRQFAAAGLHERMKVVSATFGLGSEQVVLDPKESKDIVATYPYFQEIESEANRKFRDLWAKAYGNNHGYITDSAVTVWNGWHLWAIAANQAGSTDRDKIVAALESGLSFDGPSGTVTIDPGSHHVVQNIHFGKVNEKNGFDVIGSQQAVAPYFEQEMCDLIKNSNTNKQFLPTTQ